MIRTLAPDGGMRGSVTGLPISTMYRSMLQASAVAGSVAGGMGGAGSGAGAAAGSTGAAGVGSLAGEHAISATPATSARSVFFMEGEVGAENGLQVNGQLALERNGH